MKWSIRRRFVAIATVARRTGNGVARWMNLRRAWLLYVSALTIFVIVSVYYPNGLLLQLGTTSLTIIAMYLIMITSNIELRKSTERQVQSFVEQLQTVGMELKNVSNGLERTIEVLKKVETTLAQLTGKTSELVAIEQREIAERIELLKPKISIVAQRRRMLLFWEDYFLIVRNNGGDAKDLQVSYLRKGEWYPTVPPKQLKRNEQFEINCGNVNEYKTASYISTTVITYDNEGRLYEGTANVGIGSPQTVFVVLTEHIIIS